MLLSGVIALAGQAAPLQAGSDALEPVLDCVHDQLPHQAAGACSGLLMEACMAPVTSDHERHALACWAEEERLWRDWAAEAALEAAQIMAPQRSGAAEDIARVQALWESWTGAACALHPLAWPGDSNGALLEAQCRVRHAAQQAVELYWLSRP